MGKAKETPVSGQKIAYDEIIMGDVINFGSVFITVNYADHNGVYDIYGNHYPLDSLPRDIYYVRNLFDE